MKKYFLHICYVIIGLISSYMFIFHLVQNIRKSEVSQIEKASLLSILHENIDLTDEDKSIVNQLSNYFLGKKDRVEINTDLINSINVKSKNSGLLKTFSNQCNLNVSNNKIIRKINVLINYFKNYVQFNDNAIKFLENFYYNLEDDVFGAFHLDSKGRQRISFLMNTEHGIVDLTKYKHNNVLAINLIPLKKEYPKELRNYYLWSSNKPFLHLLIGKAQVSAKRSINFLGYNKNKNEMMFKLNTDGEDYKDRININGLLVNPKKENTIFCYEGSNNSYCKLAKYQLDDSNSNLNKVNYYNFISSFNKERLDFYFSDWNFMYLSNVCEILNNDNLSNKIKITQKKIKETCPQSSFQMNVSEIDEFKNYCYSFFDKYKLLRAAHLNNTLLDEETRSHFIKSKPLQDGEQ